MTKSQPRLPFRTAFLWILLSTLMISGSTFAGLSYYRYIKKQRFSNAQYNIVAIVQTTPEKERLKTIYLAELLQLSIDHPTNLFRFNVREAQRTLLASPLITSAYVKKIMPGTIYVDYTLRKPLVYLLDYANTVLDHQAVAFPFKPFFTPKKLPEIYLGMSEPLVWGKPIQGIKSRLALYLTELITENCCKDGLNLVRVDVSNALADSYGQRQIVIIIEDHLEKINEDGTAQRITAPQILRLSVDNYRKELANYLAMRPWLRKKSLNTTLDKETHARQVIIDLRIPELAYIKEF